MLPIVPTQLGLLEEQIHPGLDQPKWVMALIRAGQFQEFLESRLVDS